MESLYKTNLTEQQYRSNFGRATNFADILRKKFESKEISEDEFRSKILLYSKKLNLLVVKESDGMEMVVHPHKIFEYKETEPIKYKDTVEKSDYPSIIKTEVIVPKQFVTVSDRNAPCEIVNKPNVKEIMLNSINYSIDANREIHYTLCETQKGIKVSSPSFGSEGQVSRRTEKTKNKCTHEFGKKSKEIGEFHTHPGLGYEAFSVQDLQSFKDDPFRYNNSNCVVSKIKNKKGIEKTRVRCTTGVDAKRFLRSIGTKEEQEDEEEVIEKFHERFNRDPNLQNAFSCTVDISKTSKLKPNNKIKKSGYDREYGGKVVSYKKEKPSKNISKEVKQSISKKPRPKIKSDESFLGLGAYL